MERPRMPASSRSWAGRTAWARLRRRANGSGMKAVTADSSDRYSTFSLVRRLLVDEAWSHWPRYVIAYVLMGIAAGATALTAYLVGTMTNEAYVNHNLHALTIVGVVAIALFTIKGGDRDPLLDRQQHP